MTTSTSITGQPPLEIHLHLCNGNTHKFIQNDPAAIKHVLEHLTVKVFDHPTLVLSLPNSAITYAANALCGISLVIDPLPAELQTLSDAQVHLQEIAEGTYLSLRNQLQSMEEGQPLALVQEVEMTNGRRLWLAATADTAASKMRERYILSSFFTHPALVCHRLGGGISLWNRSQMASVSFFPKPEPPATAWAAEILPEATEFRI